MKLQAKVKENITQIDLCHIFRVPQDVRLNSTHYLVMKNHKKKELQDIATNHLADIDYKDFIKVYRKHTNNPYFFDHSYYITNL